VLRNGKGRELRLSEGARQGPALGDGQATQPLLEPEWRSGELLQGQGPIFGIEDIQRDRFQAGGALGLRDRDPHDLDGIPGPPERERGTI
jgi:hypothetical protein